MYLFDLPVIVLEHVFSFLTYDEIARNRIVCKDFDDICKRILNRGFHMIERRHSLSLKAIKAMLPRRESERRFHNLARHCDILTSVETRLSMLSMTYTKYIDNNMCCFIPGKVIDEIRRVLSIVEQSHTLPRAHEVLQELRDISSMAIEHFDDRVAPKLRLKILENSKATTSTNNTMPVSKPPPSGSIETVKMNYVKGQRALINLSKRLQAMEKKMKSYKQQLRVQKHMILYMSRKQSLQNANMAELKKRIEECDVKYRELTHSQGGIKGISSAPHTEVCSPTVDPQPPVLRHYSSQIRLDPMPSRTKRTGRDSPNIKPRKTTLDHPSLNILSQSLSVSAAAKRPRLSNMSMEDSMDSESNSSQDIHDITDDPQPRKITSSNKSNSSKNLGDITEDELQSAISRLSKSTMDFRNVLRNELGNNVLDKEDDCILDNPQEPK